MAELSASDHILILFLNFIFFSSFYVCFNARSQPCSKEASPVCWVFSIWHLPLLHWIRVAINLKYLVFSSAQWCFVHNSREFVVLCASRLFPILWDLTFWIKSLVGHGESFSFMPSFLLETFIINHVCSIIYDSHFPCIDLEFLDRCILVDENDRVVGHESKYNCKSNLFQYWFVRSKFFWECQYLWFCLVWALDGGLMMHNLLT